MADATAPVPASPSPAQPVQPQGQTVADSTVATTLSTAFPGEPVHPTSMGAKEAPVLRAPESGNSSAEVAPAPSTENEPSREKEMNLERLESQIQEAKARGPKKVAVAADTLPVEEPKTVAQAVVILPLTEQKMQTAKRKDATYSVKWLWSWCRRQMKKFADIVVLYREPPKSS